MTGHQIMESLLLSFTHIANAVPFSAATWVVIMTLGFFVLLFAKASHTKGNNVNWEHLIIETATNRASPYKVGYLVGIIVATWIVVQLLDKGNLSLDIFGAYLAYLLGGASVNMFKKRAEPPPEEPTDEQK